MLCSGFQYLDLLLSLLSDEVKLALVLAGVIMPENTGEVLGFVTILTELCVSAQQISFRISEFELDVNAKLKSSFG